MKLHRIQLTSIALISAILLSISPRERAAENRPTEKTASETNRATSISGFVVNEAGQPLAGVNVVMIVPPTNVAKIVNGRLAGAYPTMYCGKPGRPPETSPGNLAHAVSGADGSFSLPSQGDNFLLLAIHDSGYAKMTDAEFKTNSQMTLHPWATVQGVVTTGTKPAAKQTLSLGYPLPCDSLGRGLVDLAKPRVDASYNVETDENGRFRIKRVMAGEAGICKVLRTIGQRMQISPGGTNLLVEPGKTVDVAIGGNGRPVVGRIDVPSDLKDKSIEVHLTTKVEIPKLKYPDEVWRMTTQELDKWRNNFGKTPEGKAYEQERHNAFKGWKDFPVRLEDDGSFRADEVTAGTYTLSIRYFVPPDPGSPVQMDFNLATVSHEFTMPPIPGGVSDEPLDLGTLQVARINYLRFGDAAPPLTFKTLDGKEVKLEDFKGKYILLSFWDTSYDSLRWGIPRLKDVYDAFGRDDRFVMIGLSTDETPDAPKKCVQGHDIKWLQGFLGQGTNSQTVQYSYGVRRIPSALLIGPDGKVVDAYLDWQYIKTAVANALKK